jgi:hypothetical protein
MRIGGNLRELDCFEWKHTALSAGALPVADGKLAFVAAAPRRSLFQRLN